LQSGKDGQNVRLAYKLTQYRIEKKEGETPKSEDKGDAEEVAAENAVAKVREDIADDDAKPVIADEGSRKRGECFGCRRSKCSKRRRG